MPNIGYLASQLQFFPLLFEAAFVNLSVCRHLQVAGLYSVWKLEKFKGSTVMEICTLFLPEVY